MIGYIGEITVDIDLAETYYTTNGTFLLLFISICLQHQAFYKMYQYSVSKWDQAGKDGSYEKFLRNLIRSHITTKEWVTRTLRFAKTTIWLHIFWLSQMVFGISRGIQPIDCGSINLRNAFYLLHYISNRSG